MKRTGLILLLLLPLFAKGQAVNYEAECSRVYQAYIDDPGNVACLLGMAEFYRDSLNPMCNYSLAIKYARQAEERFVELVGCRKHYKEVTALLKRHITIDSIRTLKRLVEEQAIHYVAHSPELTQADLTAIGGAFRGCPEVVKAVEQRRFGESFLDTQREHTMLAYHLFEEKYRGSEPAREAQRMLVQLADSLIRQALTEQEVDDIVRGYESYEAINRLAVKRKATLAYAGAVEMHTEEGYRAFLSRYPSADEYPLALEQLDLLLRTRYAALRTPRQLADFAHQNPDSPLAEEAMERLREYVGERQDLAAAKIYFKEFPRDADYGALYRQYYLRHLEEGNADPIARFQEENPDFPFFSSTHDDLRRARTRDTINSLLMRPYSEAIFLEFAKYVRRLEGKGLSLVALQRTLQAHLAARDWKACNERLDYFMFTFEEELAAPYAALRELVNTPSAKQFDPVPELAPAGHVLSAALLPQGRQMLYTLRKGHSLTVQTAVREGKTWRNTGPALFDNIANEDLRLFSLYDNGRRMLLGQGGDILMAEWQDSLWHVTEIPPYPVNTDYEEYDAFMLPDGSGLLLASDRPNGNNLQHSRAPFHGDTALASDIYFIPRSLYGWGEPVNLGIQVNTPFCDHAPLLSSDLKTLYFISDGHTGLGYGDLFFCTRTDVDDWTSWSEPINYGRLSNSGLDEASIAFAPDERTLLLASNRGGRYAVYSLPTRHTPASKHLQLTLSAGTETLVDLLDLGTQCVVGQYTLPHDNQPVPLQVNQDKSFAVLPHTQSTRFIPSEVVHPRQGLRVELREFTPGHAPSSPLPLPIVQFEPNTAVLTPAAQRELDNLGAYLANQPDIGKVYLSVNVPGRDDQQCYELSRARAVALKRHLERQGVAPSRVVITAYGNVNYQAKGRAPQAEVEVLW